MSRRNPNDAYAWALARRVMGGGLMQRHPALAEIARDTHSRLVIVKSAQVGMTELAVNIALYASATGFANRGNVLFVMPTQNVMDDFAQQRFDRAIQDSPWLRSMLQPEPPRRKKADSRRLKQFGNGWIFFRSADRGQLASVDADWVFLDEADLMDEAAYSLAEKRLASSRDGRLWIISTPRFPGAGVHGLYLESDQRHYFIPCPACSLEQRLTWEDNVDQVSEKVVCRRCYGPMNVLAEGRWIAEAPGNDFYHGYHLNRLYSPWANISAMIEASKSTTPWALQEFQNSDLGEPFILPDGGLQRDELDRCCAAYSMSDYQGQECVMGVDVGMHLHVVCREATPLRSIRAWEVSSDFSPRLWYAGTVRSFSDLDL